jgi:hypothetical protein
MALRQKPYEVRGGLEIVQARERVKVIYAESGNGQ